MSEGQISPWHPETEPLRIAVLGKMGEEAGELSSRACRCIIQGLDELDPDTGRTNRAELAREIADVEACIQSIKRELNVDYEDRRVNDKRNGFKRWFDMLRAPQ